MRRIIFSLASIIVFCMISCQYQNTDPVSPDESATIEKKVKVTYSVELTNGNGSLVSSCPGETSGRNLTAYFEDGCLQFEVGTGKVSLENAMINVARRKGVISNIQLWFNYNDNVYSTLPIDITSVSEVDDNGGFTVYVNKDVEIWKHKSSKGGKRDYVEWIIGIGDMIYTKN